MAAARPALTALTLVAALSSATAYDSCCLRVTPYHIQALAQRMAQRFQALEFRAQDLRHVFASFQQVHGNVTHRLRFLEAEHAHLSELVSRMDSRVHSLEAELKMEQYKQRLEYYSRGMRSADVRIPVDELVRPQVRRPFVMRRRREVELTELPHLLVHLDQPTESFMDGMLTAPSEEPPSDNFAHAPPTSSVLLEKLGTAASVSVNNDLNSVTPEPEIVSKDPEGDVTHPSPVFVNEPTQEASQLVHDAPASDSATTPTPLWQLEETASALLNVMSAGDDDVGGSDAPSDPLDGGVSSWVPANQVDSLEELFSPKDHEEASVTSKCSELTSVNCSGEGTGVTQAPADDIPHNSSTESAILESGTHGVADNSSDGGTDTHVTFLPNVTAVGSNINASSESEPKFSNFDVKTGCRTSNIVPPSGDVGPSSDSTRNMTNLLPDMGNATGSHLDLFSSGAGGLADGPSPPQDSVGGGTEAPCGEAGCNAELSDAELQTALRELDALLQRPPASAQPPDPEKVLLKRALTLALAALERTSDACLKLVNFTADAFEGLAATEAR